MRFRNKLRAEHRGAGSARWTANKARVDLKHKTQQAEQLVKKNFQAAKHELKSKISGTVQKALDEAKQLVVKGTPPGQAVKAAVRRAMASKFGRAGGMGCPPCRQ